MSEELIASLTTAVEAAPGDAALRLHLAGMLIDAGRTDEAVSHLATVMANDPSSTAARQLMTRAIGGQAVGSESPPSTETAATTPHDASAPPTPSGEADQLGTPASDNPAGDNPAGDNPVGDIPSGDGAADHGDAGHGDAGAGGFDWGAAESEVADIAPPMFADGDPGVEGEAFDVDSPTITLADVGGMKDVKKRINASFLAPLRNKELRDLYGASMSGGLLLYGPPGCGKTFLARAVAGELGAQFLSVSLADIFDQFIGQTERNISELFELARAKAPCVLFLDELDAIGFRRTKSTQSWMRGAINQLLTDLDGVSSNNDGVFVLAASNHPWDIDPALVRPGRIDRMVLVLPPDLEAREEILRYYFARKPVSGIDVKKLAKRTDGFSGADLAFIVDAAAELALMDSVETGTPRLIGMADVETAMGDIRPSIRPWMDSAKNVVTYADPSGQYAELAKYIRKNYR